MDDLKAYIREVPDFPKPGILYYDISTLLKDPEGFKKTIDRFVEIFSEQKVDKVVGIESRGFIFGSLVAYRLNAGFVPVRKPGKLPAEVVSQSYELEYGTDQLEMHRDAIESGERVLIIDDLIAIGGTASATAELVASAGGEVTGIGFVVELTFLGGRSKLGDYPVHSLIKY